MHCEKTFCNLLRSCYPEKGEKIPFDLYDMASRYSDHRLIIFSDGVALFDSFTSQPNPWIDQLLAWKTRALLTPETINNWGYREQAVSDIDFIVMPASEKGLMGFIENIISETSQTQLPKSDTLPLPNILNGHSLNWLESHKPDTEKIDMMLDEVKQYLGETGYYWFSACNTDQINCLLPTMI